MPPAGLPPGLSVGLTALYCFLQARPGSRSMGTFEVCLATLVPWPHLSLDPTAAHSILAAALVVVVAILQRSLDAISLRITGINGDIVAVAPATEPQGMQALHPL